VSPDEGPLDLRSALADLGRLAHRWRKALTVIATVDGVKHRDAKRIAQEALANTASVEADQPSALRASAPEGISLEEIGRRICRRSAVYPTQDGDLVVEFGGMRSRLALHFEPDGKVSAVTVGMRDGHIVSEHHEHPADIGAKLHGQSRGAAPSPTPEGIDETRHWRHLANGYEAVIRWALGEVGEFPSRPDGAGAFHWRREMRERADAVGLALLDRPTQAQARTPSAAHAASAPEGFSSRALANLRTDIAIALGMTEGSEDDDSDEGLVRAIKVMREIHKEEVHAAVQRARKEWSKADRAASVEAGPSRGAVAPLAPEEISAQAMIADAMEGELRRQIADLQSTIKHERHQHAVAAEKHAAEYHRIATALGCHVHADLAAKAADLAATLQQAGAVAQGSVDHEALRAAAAASWVTTSDDDQVADMREAAVLLVGAADWIMREVVHQENRIGQEQTHARNMARAVREQAKRLQT
jgi:hypothetical protein